MTQNPNGNIVIAKGKRGGQPCNRNAFKHGYYARNLGLISPTKLDEIELRNLLGEAAMLKDYMYILYNCNLAVRDSAVLADTLRGLALAGMALARMLQVHNHIRILPSTPSSTLTDLLADMDSAATRANRLASSVSGSLSLDDDDDE